MINDLCLDKNQDIRMKKHQLAFWDQQNKIQSVTFRLSDSLPQTEIKELKSLKKSFEILNPKPWDSKTETRYRRLVSGKIEKLLDQGYGSCILQFYECRNIVEKAIQYYEEKNYYHLYAYVIMPNHIHLLLSMKEDYLLEEILGNLKRFTARKINKLLDRKGEFWYGDSYCRLIRNEEHFKNFKAYIKANPKFLKDGTYSLRI